MRKLAEQSGVVFADNEDPAEGGGDMDSNDDEDEQDDDDERGTTEIGEIEESLDFRWLSKFKRKGLRLIDVADFFFNGVSVDLTTCDSSLASNSL